jgi:2-oxoglutarate ferredoxin oxidoreductase subunit beta
MSIIQDFTGYSPTWCPGCGNWGIGAAIKAAFSQLEFSPSSVFTVFGIGCSGNMNDFLNTYTIHSLHGRAIPNAIGIKLANHKMPVIVIAGDGDCYGEGGNHLIHACRGNHDITVIVHDNCVYGLTTGQVAPTASKGYKSKSTPTGIIETPINPLTLALISGATFVAQGFAGDVSQLTNIIKKAIHHRGFSLLNILQPCVSFNKINTYEFYKEKTYLLPEDYDYRQIDYALKKSLEPIYANKFPLGIIYQIEKTTFTDSLPQLYKKILIEKERFVDYDKIIEEFM